MSRWLGNISQIVVNPDGSTTATYVNYDENGNPESGSNVTTDLSGNVSTQDVEYDSSGNPEVTGYTIDTGGNTSGTGMTVADAVDTGFIAFDGKSFSCTGEVEFATQDQGTSPYKTFISALELISENKYKGFYIRNTNLYTIGMFASNEGLTLTSTGTGGFGVGSTVQIVKARTRYTFTLNYTPGTTSGNISFTITPTGSNSGANVNTNGVGTISGQSSSLPPTMQNAKIMLGGNPILNTCEWANLTVYSFNVHKTN